MATAVLRAILLIVCTTLLTVNYSNATGGGGTGSDNTTSPVPSATTVMQPSSTSDTMSNSTTSLVPSATTVMQPSNTMSNSTTSLVPSLTTTVQPSNTSDTMSNSTTSLVPSPTTTVQPSNTSDTMSNSTTSLVPSPTTTVQPSNTSDTMSNSTTSPVPSATTAVQPSNMIISGTMSTNVTSVAMSTEQAGSGDSTSSLMPDTSTTQAPSSSITQVTISSPASPSTTTIPSDTLVPSSTVAIRSSTVAIPSSTVAIPSSTVAIPSSTVAISSSTVAPPTTSVTQSTTVPTAPASSPAAAIAGVLAAIVIVALLSVVIVLLIIFLMRRKKSKRSYELEQLLDGTDGAELKELSFKPSCRVDLDALFEHIPDIDPVLMTDLEQHMAVVEAEDGKEFYSVQEMDQEDFTTTSAKTSTNYDKNRYINILPYDQTRVMLVELPRMPGSNYINANYIAGYNSKTEYIATQGPIASTIPDFWRMIWEQGTRNIVMVTNPVEGGITKCEVYWPRDGTAQKYGVVSVTNTQETIIPTCTIRKFTLAVAHNTKDQKQRQVITRDVNQFCFTGWPDMGVPEDSSTMLKFVHRVRSAVQSNDGAIVVHCSAGVGRTGTYISIDVQLQRMKQEGDINVTQFVMQMRAQRSYMVQTEPQYMFIYKAILYAYMYGITELKREELKKHIEKLQLAFPNSEDSRLDIEYCGAVDVPDPDEEEMSVALNPVNADKNRNTSFLPYNENRLTLSDPESTGNDYINASFVGVLGRTKEYIIAEHPLPSVVPDYWKMVLDRGINAIVIMGPINDDDEVYWPVDEDPVEYDSITMQLLEHESEKGLSATMVEIECEETEQRASVSVLQLTSWPTESGEVPTTTSGMIQLLALVNQHSTGRVLVHSSCSLEDEASGVFCIANSLTKRLKDGGSVDIMKATTHLLSQRSNVIVSKDQYFFIYETLQEVDSN